MFIDENGYHVYKCKDNRLRSYDPRTKKVRSYPRVIVENLLGDSVDYNYDIHHKDCNPLNNDLDNLEIMNSIEHRKHHSPKKYHDKMMICPWCGCMFLWTKKEQINFYSNMSRNPPKNNHRIGKPFCSKHCCGSYCRQEQLNGNF